MSVDGSRIHCGTARALQEDMPRRVREGDSDIVVVQWEGGYFAFDNSCPHQHFAALHEGRLQEGTLRCPMHGWTFRIRTGKSLSGEGRLRSRRVIVQGDDLWIPLE
jgi:nitrite reductase/ring-hydroxylating ferredoxin subunit